MRPPPPLLALAAGLAQRALVPRTRPVGAVRGSGAALTAAGSMALAAAAARQFQRQGTTVEPFEPARASALVTSGPNRLTRNPMYVGMAGLLVAHAVHRGSVVGLLPVAGFVAVMSRFQIAAEERALLDNFGADYEAYAAAVPRWLPLPSYALRSSS